MSLVRKTLRTTAVAVSSFASSCDISKTHSVDPEPYLGCYSTPGIVLRLARKDLEINGKHFPYTIELMKVGAVISSKVNIINQNNLIVPVSATSEYYYRFTENNLSIVITDNQANIYILKRRNNC